MVRAPFLSRQAALNWIIQLSHLHGLKNGDPHSTRLGRYVSS